MAKASATHHAAIAAGTTRSHRTQYRVVTDVSRLNQAVADGNERDFGLIRNAEFLLDVVEVRADGRGGQLEIIGDALHRGAACEPDEHLEFALREPLDRRLAGAFDLRERELLRETSLEI